MAHNNTKLQDVKPFDNKKVSIVSLDTEYLIPDWCMENIECYYDEYVQFELKNKEMWDSDSEPVDTGYETCLGNYINVKKTFCYLCDVQIPLPYISEHLESPKHLTHRKIAEVGMKKIKKQMEQNYYIEAPPPSMYFCSTCIIVIAEIDKKQHLNSQSHKNAALLDKILNDFLKVYTNHETDMDDEKEPENVSSRVDDEKIQSTKLTLDVTNNNNARYKNLNAGNDVRDCKDFISNNKFNTPAESSVNVVTAVTNLEEYIKGLNSNLSTCRLEYIDGFYLKIITEDKIFLKVKHENYHGLVALGKQLVECKLCMSTFRNMKKHMLLSEHIVKLQLPINKDCIRKLDDTKNHCIICNDIIYKPDHHALFNKTHDKMFMTALKFDADEKVVETVNTQSTASYSVTNRDNKTGAVPKTTVAQRVPHVDVETLKGHKRSGPCVKEEPGKATEDPELKDVVWGSDVDDWFAQNSNIHYHLESTPKNQLKCKICNITFPINKSNEHLFDRKHISAYEDLILLNCLKKLPKHFYCQICATYMSHGEELDHIISSSHVLMPPISKFNNNVSSVKTSAFLNRGNEDPLNGQESHGENDKIINNGQSLHSGGEVQFVKNENAAGTASGNAVSNTAVVPQTRSDEDPGKPKANKKNQAVSKKNDKLKQTVLTGECTNIDDSRGENYQNVGTDSCKYVCKVCSITISGNGTGITDHVNEGYHMNYVRVIEYNRLKIVGNVYYCELCHHCVSIGQHFNHMHEQTHVHYLNTLANRFPGATTLTNDTRLGSHFSIIATVPARKDAFYEMMKTRNQGEYKCRVCVTIVPKRKFLLKSHVEDMKHRKLIQELLTENLVMELLEYFNCCVCCVKVPKENLFDHVNDTNHKKKLLINQSAKRNLKGVLICYLCNVVNSRDHEAGLMHLNNAKAMAANDIVVVGEICFCETCNFYFTRQFIEKHISMSKHLASITHTQRSTNMSSGEVALIKE